MRTIFIFLAFMALLFIGITGCGNNKKNQREPPPVQVAVYQVKAESANFFDSYPATVVALNQVELRPEVSGNITNIYFKDGQHVRKGMKLYTIDQQQYLAAYEQAVANLNVAKANLARALQDADRYNELGKQDAIARQQLEHAQADLRTAQMQVQAAEANVRGVETNLRYSTIIAPFDGTIGISSVQLGSSVSTGQTLLNTISSDDPIAVDFGVDEKQLPRFIQLLNVKSNPKDSTFTIVLPDQTIYPYTGHLILLDRAVDPTTGNIRARVEFPNPKNILKAGITCDMRVKNTSASGSLIIPFRAVTEQMGEYFVFVVNGNRVSQQKINVGPNIGAMIVVSEGLKPGDQVVTEGMQRLKDNALVTIKPAGQNQK
ncbi:MAG: efflux RND transporter periplasmic adaptor subunit [Bacteroidota bacterium]|nr:efflux RND transporter periplasmic adaptor subunit [Bacteroidota bacterium]